MADLSGVVFPSNISFERLWSRERILPSIQFLGTSFSGDAWFREAKFGDHVSFAGATFVGRGDFARACFEDGAWFDSTTFNDEAAFHEARFVADAIFDRARFEGTAWFRGATFSGVARFERAKFRGPAGFHQATFASLTKFERAKFGARVAFDKATFGGDVNFEKAKFAGDAEFLGDPTSERADTFPGFVNFRSSTFNGPASFNNRRFLQCTDFREAVFAVAPKFHNAVLHQDTQFAKTRFLDFRGTDEMDAAMAYRTLKLAMASVRATDEEARFYGYEQQSLRKRPDTPRAVKLFSWLYEKTAEYGQSFLRPLLCLIGAFMLFSLVYFAALVGPVTTWADVLTVLRFALQQVFQPFSAFRSGAILPGTADQVVPLGLASLGAVHSLLTFSFLALFLLALRRRFRLN